MFADLCLRVFAGGEFTVVFTMCLRFGFARASLVNSPCYLCLRSVCASNLLVFAFGKRRVYGVFTESRIWLCVFTFLASKCSRVCVYAVFTCFWGCVCVRVFALS